MKLLKDISSRNLTITNGKDSLLSEIYKIYNDFYEILELAKEEETQVPYQLDEKKVSKKYRPGVDKKLSKMFLANLVPGCEKVSITITHKYYFLAHLTQADFSMLSDF